MTLVSRLLSLFITSTAVETKHLTAPRPPHKNEVIKIHGTHRRFPPILPGLMSFSSSLLMFIWGEAPGLSGRGGGEILAMLECHRLAQRSNGRFPVQSTELPFWKDRRS